MKKNPQVHRWLGTVLAGAMVLGAVSTDAKKPPKPPPQPDPPVDTGVIYAQIEGDVYALTPDGSGEQYLFTPPEEVEAMQLEASRLPHNGERWFVAWKAIDGWYPDGVSRRVQLIAMSASGGVVVLHDNVLLQPSMASPTAPRWMPDDSAVSWPAMRWEGETIVEWGIYTLAVVFNAGGSVEVGSPELVPWTEGLFELWYEAPPSPWLEGCYLLVEDFDWAPDAGAIVYSASFSEDFVRQLYIADETGDVLPLTNDVDTYPENARWSPDGNRIVFQLNNQHQIDVINADGSGRRTLVTTSRTDYREMVFLPRWSPASTHVVYCDFTAGPRLLWRKDALHIIAADGSGDTALTGNYTLVHPLGWCGE